MDDEPHFPAGSVAWYVLYLQIFQFTILESVWINHFTAGSAKKELQYFAILDKDSINPLDAMDDYNSSFVANNRKTGWQLLLRKSGELPAFSTSPYTHRAIQRPGAENYLDLMNPYWSAPYESILEAWNRAQERKMEEMEAKIKAQGERIESLEGVTQMNNSDKARRGRRSWWLPARLTEQYVPIIMLFQERAGVLWIVDAFTVPGYNFKLDP